MISEQRVRAIQLVSYSDTEDEDETAQLDCAPKAPFQPLVSLDSESAAVIKPVRPDNKDCAPKAPSQPLVSLDSESAAVIKPVRPDNKEICPPNLCKMKKANKRSWWVQCSVVECGQWYHQ